MYTLSIHRVHVPERLTGGSWFMLVVLVFRIVCYGKIEGEGTHVFIYLCRRDNTRPSHEVCQLSGCMISSGKGVVKRPKTPTGVSRKTEQEHNGETPER